MKVTWELDSSNPVDIQILNGLHRLVTFTQMPDEQQLAAMGDDNLAGKVAETESAPAAEAKTEAKTEAKKTTTKKTTKKRKPKEKTKEQLLKLNLAKMVDYALARADSVTVLECRILAKHYNDETGDIEPILGVLHELGANNFDDLEDAPGFIKKVVAMLDNDGDGDGDDVGEETDDLLGV